MVRVLSKINVSKYVLYSAAIILGILIILSLVLLNNSLSNKNIIRTKVTDDQKTSNLGSLGDSSVNSELSEGYSYYYNQGFDALGKLFIKIPNKVLEKKGIGEYEILLIENLCYYPFPKDPFESGKLLVEENCGAVKNTINTKEDFSIEIYDLAKRDINLAREVIDILYDSEETLKECGSGDKTVFCNTNWHSWLFDKNLNFASSYPTPPNYCLGIRNSKSKSCFLDVMTCFSSCKEGYLKESMSIANQIRDTELQEIAFRESTISASTCAISCIQEANLCCKKKFLAS